MKYPQPDRDLLNKHMLLCKNYIAGDVVDVGGGNNRYKKYFNYSSWTNANLKKDQLIYIYLNIHLLPLIPPTIYDYLRVGLLYSPMHSLQMFAGIILNGSLI